MSRRSLWTPPRHPFTLEHVAPLGVTPTMIRRATAAGSITRLTHGVYVAAEAVPEDPAELHVTVALAIQLRNPAAIASHGTAALAWGLDLADARAAAAAPPEFIVPSGSGARSSTGPEARFHMRDLPAHHRTALPADCWSPRPLGPRSTWRRSCPSPRRS